MRSTSVQTSRPPRRSSRFNRVGPLLIVFALMGSTLSGCSTMWDRVREQERLFAISNARTQTSRGQCAAALQSMDRAEARIDLGAYAREATNARVRCYEKLGQNEMAAAHRRLRADFYTEEPMAFPDTDGSSIFRVKTLPTTDFERPPKWLELTAPRYTPYAQRSKIVGRVVIAFELGNNSRPRRIHVLEMNHPLLATWAIEAIASAKPSRKKSDGLLLTGGHYVTTFVFEWRWAQEEPASELDS